MILTSGLSQFLRPNNWKVKNRIAANAYRRLQSNFFLMIQLGMYEAMGGWQYINESPARLQAVTAEDIRRVAETYFTPTNSAVAIYTRKAGAAPKDPELAAMDEETRARVRTMLAALKQRTDPNQLRQMLGMMEAMMGQVPPEDRPATEYILKKMKEHLAQLEASGEN